MSVYLDDGDVKILCGDALETLRGLPDESVNCVITSPPYWGLRDYQTGSWDGGDEGCDHRIDPRPLLHGQGRQGNAYGTPPGGNASRATAYRDVCGRCGARRVDRQLGLEPTPDEYVSRMVGVFREVRRVLRRDGVCWVNMGDGYASSQPGGGSVFDNGRTDGRRSYEGDKARGRETRSTLSPGLKPKDLVGQPWRLAFALQADGWYLRADVIWSKPNPMPESVTDRPTKAHEYVFLLTRSARYWYDADAVREPQSPSTIERWGEAPSRVDNGGRYERHAFSREEMARTGRGEHTFGVPASGRNLRSVWEIATQPYAEAHFATFPEELVRRALLAGCPGWVCSVCSRPRERIVDVSYEKSPVHGSGSVVGRHYETGANNFDGAGMPRVSKRTETVGWSDCGHDAYRPGVCLDPFGGSGTTGLVARKHNRRAVLIELSESYCELAARRLQQLSLLAEV